VRLPAAESNACRGAYGLALQEWLGVAGTR
jgi:hypothetical protein